MTAPYIQALAHDGAHRFSKQTAQSPTLLKGFGVEGDAHAGVTVKHRSRVAHDPSQPNLRQLHLLHSEIFEDLAPQGFALKPGDIGENVTTRGLDLLGLGTGTRLCLGTEAVLEITGLRNPCAQLDHFQAGLMAAMLGRDAAGGFIRKSGVMAIVLQGGVLRLGNPIIVIPPAGPHRPLLPV
ncbi:MAG: MOSC domain-containing protein [Alphaproteobacteria bacterium]|nr:MOSC domain-containing protein [Alphaproteobacteria bacterium]